MTRTVWLFVFLASIFASVVQAQNTAEKTILVLDASGSMWGQIDGIAKITIAQEVVGDLLQSIPEETALGLTVYGHNRKGDCSDIETLVSAEIGNRAAIADAVNSISPKGKTPLSEAVVKAAEALRYEEDKATVILISDGVETCDFDPCAIGENLEQTGVDFTAHVVGFDVTGADQDGLRCLAENTGGQFLSASNAEELGAALETVAATPPPEPISVTFVAHEEETETVITTDLVWSVHDTAGALIENDATSQISHDVQPDGIYRIDVLRTSDEAFATLELTYSETMAIEHVLYLPAFIPTGEMIAPDAALVGETITVTWEGPVGEGDYVSVTTEGTRNHERIYRGTMEGTSTTTVLMPNTPGTYELRYIQANTAANGDDVVLATSTIDIGDIETTLSAPDSAPAGEMIVVEWAGPSYSADYISVATPGAKAHQRIHAERILEDDNRVRLLMPGEPGSYEIRYILAMAPANGDDRIMAMQEITIEEVRATITADTVAKAGDELVVTWTGPAAPGDYISVAVPGSRNHQRIYRADLTEDDRIRLLMPGDAGEYEVRYVLSVTNSNGDDEVLAMQMVTVEAEAATLEAQSSALAGETISVDFEGPAKRGDYISIATVGTKNHQRIYRTDVEQGSPAQLLMPGHGGDYVIRYVMALTNANGDDVVVEEIPISISDHEVTLSTNGALIAGETIMVDWSGPGFDADYISVAELGTTPHQRITRAGVKGDGRLELQLPEQAGTYELRYVLGMTNANGDDVIAERIDITVQ